MLRRVGGSTVIGSCMRARPARKPRSVGHRIAAGWLNVDGQGGPRHFRHALGCSCRHCSALPPQRCWQGITRLASSEQSGACQNDRGNRGRDRQHDDDQPDVQGKARAPRAEVDDGGEGDDPRRQRGGQGRRVHAQEEVGQPPQTERGHQHHAAAAQEQHRHQDFAQGRHDRGHGQITSPRSRNLAIATDPTNPNSTISSAPSKYISLS
mmetsp:Transcript_44565/g.104711  ORF Transcript_44565/g.104711 Transcript_44565/m.104711 type:complete len:209 (+) Transcript_44565:1690-2316(+)